MTPQLAVFTSQIGTASETFIRRHVEDLMPRRTVVVARHSASTTGRFWDASSPVFCIDRWTREMTTRVARQVGISEMRLRDAALARFLRRHAVTIVLGEYLDQFVEFVPLLDRMRLPYVVQGHGIDVSAALRTSGMAQRYLAYRSASAVLTRCEFHRKRLVTLGLPAERVHVNFGGVDVPDVTPKRTPEAAKRFLAIGRMVPKKGPLYLLEAFRMAASKDPAISLDYIGDGALLAAARQFVDACRLGARVRLHGAAPEEIKQRLFCECGTIVQHSVTDPDTGDEEGLPAAIQEGMAQGMAVISTRHSGIPEAVLDGVMGILVNEGDSASMAQAMLHVASEDRDRLEFGAAARTKAEQLYSWPAERARLLQHLGVRH